MDLNGIASIVEYFLASLKHFFETLLGLFDRVDEVLPDTVPKA